MNEVLGSYSNPTATQQNPLLEINTSFSSYLTARTRTFKDHMVGGRIDYAFDADFSLRQKLNSHSGWSKIYKIMVGTEIPNKFKKIFQTTSEAGSMKYPNAYDAIKVCAERLQIAVPKVYVRNAPNKLEISSLSAENLEPVIIITSGLCEACTQNELQFLMGCECGHIQNNHCIYYAASPYFGIVMDSDILNPVADQSHVKQMTSTMINWIKLSDVTADRAGIICCDKPSDYAEVFSSIRKKGINDIYSRIGNDYDYDRSMKMYDTLHVTPARHILLDDTWSSVERRFFAGMEFLNCEILYNWRTDIEKTEIHTVNKQALEVRCEIILGTNNSNGGAK